MAKSYSREQGLHTPSTVLSQCCSNPVLRVPLSLRQGVPGPGMSVWLLSLREPRGQSTSAYHFLGTGITGETGLQSSPTLRGNWECFLCGDSELLIWCTGIPFSFYGGLRTEGRNPLLDTRGLPVRLGGGSLLKKTKSWGHRCSDEPGCWACSVCCPVPLSKQFTFLSLSRMGHYIRFQTCPQTGQAPLPSSPPPPSTPLLGTGSQVSRG